MNSIEELSKKIEEYKQRQNNKKVKKKENAAVYVLAELLAAVIVGVMIGLGLDYYFETKPVFMIIFFIIGAISSFWNIYKFMVK